jgi:acetyl esterase/lipase
MRLVFAFLALVFSDVGAFAQEPAKRARGYPPEMETTQAEVYKTVGDVKLSLWIYTPEGHKPGDGRAAIVFFFGGGWRNGSPKQFEPQCKYLASRGMVAIAADYRVASRHNVKAKECVADAKSAVRWIRRHAASLGIDPNRLAAGGGSAGGHLAACTGIVPGFDEASEDASVSSIPNALVLFNPAVLLATVEGQRPLNPERAGDILERIGVEPAQLSPYHHVKAESPPTIIFHGQDDATVPYRTVELFAEAMEKAGAPCKLVGYEGQGHGFFNYGRGDNAMYRRTLAAMDEFLTELAYLGPRPGSLIPESQALPTTPILHHSIAPPRSIGAKKRGSRSLTGSFLTTTRTAPFAGVISHPQRLAQTWVSSAPKKKIIDE